MTTPTVPDTCRECIHLTGKWNKRTGRLRCKAFPKGIPDIIYKGNRHRKAIDGDGGVQFERLLD